MGSDIGSEMAHCLLGECIYSPALKQARVKGAINLTPVFPSSSFSSLWLVPQEHLLQITFRAPGILRRIRKRFAAVRCTNLLYLRLLYFCFPFSFFYLIPVARHVCPNKFLLYIENACAALYVEDINNDGTAAVSVAFLSPFSLFRFSVPSFPSPLSNVGKFNFDNARHKARISINFIPMLFFSSRTVSLLSLRFTVIDLFSSGSLPRGRERRHR